jgi:hypothetical protein
VVIILKKKFDVVVAEWIALMTIFFVVAALRTIGLI